MSSFPNRPQSFPLTGQPAGPAQPPMAQGRPMPPQQGFTAQPAQMFRPKTFTAQPGGPMPSWAPVKPQGPMIGQPPPGPMIGQPPPGFPKPQTPPGPMIGQPPPGYPKPGGPMQPPTTTERYVPRNFPADQKFPGLPQPPGGLGGGQPGGYERAMLGGGQQGSRQEAQQGGDPRSRVGPGGGYDGSGIMGGQQGGPMKPPAGEQLNQDRAVAEAEMRRRAQAEFQPQGQPFPGPQTERYVSRNMPTLAGGTAGGAPTTATISGLQGSPVAGANLEQERLRQMQQGITRQGGTQAQPNPLQRFPQPGQDSMLAISNPQMRLGQFLGGKRM